jgi:hypothetical protein
MFPSCYFLFPSISLFPLYYTDGKFDIWHRGKIQVKEAWEPNVEENIFTQKRGSSRSFTICILSRIDYGIQMKEDSMFGTCRTHGDYYKFVAFLVWNIGYLGTESSQVTIIKVSVNGEPLYAPARASGGRCNAVWGTKCHRGRDISNIARISEKNKSPTFLRYYTDRMENMSNNTLRVSVYRFVV